MGREHHGTNCAYRADPDEPCTCGVTERTEREMHAAWRKRAEEAETALAAMTKERDAQVEAVRVLGRLAYCQAKREKLLNMDPTSTHPEVAEEQVANGIALIRVMGEVGANPIARAAVEEEKA